MNERSELPAPLSPENQRWELEQVELRSADSIDHLRITGRTRNALARQGITTVTKLLDLLDESGEQRPHIRGLGETGWADIDAALEQPLIRW